MENKSEVRDDGTDVSEVAVMTDIEDKQPNPNSIRYQLRKKWQSMTIRKKRRLIIKIILFIVCLSLLTYHSLLLFAQYFSGKTVVNIILERIRPDPMPAITICYPYGLRMDGMARRFPELRDQWLHYKRLMDSINEYDYKNETLKEHLIDIYENFTKFYDKQNLPLDYMFDSDVSIPFDLWKDSGINDDGNHTQRSYLIRITLYGVKNHQVMRHMEVNPIVSVVAEEPGHIRKCFTFFSELNPKWRQFQFNFNEVLLTITHSKYWFPPNLYDQPSGKNKIHFSLHAANATPYDLRSENFIKLKMNHQYQVQFSTIKTVRLPAPYETRCREYDPDAVRQQERTRSDCRYKCFMNDILSRRLCCLDRRDYSDRTCKSCTLWSTNFIQYHFGQGTRMCPHLLKDSCALVADYRCDDVDRCERDCQTCLYDDKEVFVELQHNPLLDQTVTHEPEMSPISFIANMGGLIGMWLGLSAYIVLDTLMKLL
ncbi:unnamed protein product [Medioppia subpectinata]|uniref:Uncharacterized protein n=1 Tax=Medioppia subpectinata TaxID=1979941 RepID=A0A7R9KSJ1_9ACAR|nr:unnamed protein product [Medioppia subpectinata]CAG2107824.1 unnamed protein product [Medioppia subpectinata]